MLYLTPKEAKRLISRYRKAVEQSNTQSAVALLPSVKQLLVECFTADPTDQKHYSSVVYELYKLPTQEMQNLLQTVYKVTYQIAHEQLEEANAETELEDYICQRLIENG